MVCCAWLTEMQVIFHEKRLSYKCAAGHNNDNNPPTIAILILPQESVSVSVFRT